MAIAKNGPFGLFKGKLGANYAYISGDRTILRARPHITKPRSEKQKANEQKMAVINVLLKVITAYLSVGFKLSSIKNNNSPVNSATSYNLKNAVKGVYPDKQIDFAAVRLTEGALALPDSPQVISTNEGFSFTWDYNKDKPGDWAGRKDKTMLMAFFPENKTPFYWISGAERQTGADALIILPEFKGKEAEVYLSFVTDNRMAISNSVYLGRVLY